MMQNLKRRVGKIEEKFGMDRDDEIIEFPLGDGHVIRLTHREWKEAWDQATRSNNRFVPGGVEHE